MKRFIICLAVSFALLFPLSCGKENPSPAATGADGLFAVKPGASINLAYILRDTEKDYEMSFFGPRDGSGNLSGITSVTLNRVSSKDTVYNFLMDSQSRVKALFVSVKGTNLGRLIKVSYANDFINVTGYEINWSTGAIANKESALLNTPDISIKKILSGRSQLLPGPDLVKLSVKGTMLVMGVLAITESLVVVGAGAPVLLPALAIMGGAILISKGFEGFEKELEKHNITSFAQFAEQLSNSNVPGQASAEIDSPASTVDPEASYQSTLISNPQLDWCSEVVTFEYPYWLYYYNGNPVINYGSLDPSVTANVKDVNTTILKPNQFPACAGPSSATVLGTRSFLLKRGASIEYTYHYSTAVCVSTPAVYTVALQFECP